MEKDGYDVFAGFDNLDGIKAFIDYCLFTYDVDLFEKKLMSGDKEFLSKHRPVFRKAKKTEMPDQAG